MSEQTNVSRRGFVAGTAATAAAVAMTGLGTNFAHAAGSDVIKVGLIGCGGRGTGAAKDNAAASKRVKIVAMGDVFKDHIEQKKKQLSGLGEQFAVTDENTFVGFDAYQKVLATDVDLVILATPPGFRPTHLKAAAEAGKHIFAEKPVAVDAAGVKMILEAAETLKKNNKALVVGTQRRHDVGYNETIKRIKGGAIGEIVSGNFYWNQGSLWMHPRKPEWSDMEWQLRNWLYFTWLSGDHIVEQHVHQIDVMNWVMGGPPKAAYAMGGRQVRTDPAYGHVFDHFYVEFEYENGARISSMCRQQDGTDARVSEHVVGTKGTSNCATTITPTDGKRWRFDRPKDAVGPYQQEHVDLIKSIEDGKPLNEGKQIAESTLSAIMGRMSAYTGKTVTWEQAMNSKEELMPGRLEMGSIPVAPVAVPGKTPLV
jgi:predicted dehydrogenase